MTVQPSGTSPAPANDGPCFHCGASRAACESPSTPPLRCCPTRRAIPTGGAHAERPVARPAAEAGRTLAETPNLVPERPAWSEASIAPPALDAIPRSGPADPPQRPADTDRDPQRDVTVILQRAYRPGDDWNDLLDRLTPEEVTVLRRLFPHMPPQAARHFAERFIIPGGPAC